MRRLLKVLIYVVPILLGVSVLALLQRGPHKDEVWPASSSEDPNLENEDSQFHSLAAQQPTPKEVIQKLSVEKDHIVRSKLCQSLALMRDPSSFRFLLGSFTEHPDSDVMQASEQAILGMMNEGLMRQLVTAYRTVSKPSAKKLALLVERVQTAEAFPVLEEMLQASAINPDDPLTLSALHTLAVTGTPYAAAALARRLDQAATSEEEAILTNALAAVSRSGTENELIAIAQGKQDVTRAITRAGAIRALANYPISQVSGALQQLAADPESLVASTAASVLNSFSGK